jgi:hypothetical protein
MPHVVRSVPKFVDTTTGLGYRVRICGRLRPGGTWEGWIEFDPDDDSPVLRTRQETVQPNLVDLEYWASGLSEIYLDGALQRAIDAARPSQVIGERVEVPTFDGPAPTGPLRIATEDEMVAQEDLDADDDFVPETETDTEPPTDTRPHSW